MEVRRIFEAIKALVSTPSGTGGLKFEEQSLKDRLEVNVTSYRTLLKDPKYDKLSVLLDTRKSAVVGVTLCLKDHPNLDLYNTFTTEALALLAILDDELRTLHAEDLKTEAATASVKPHYAPPAAKALLSISDSKVLCSLLEFVVSLGLYPYLLPGVDALLKARLKHAQYITKATDLPGSDAERVLHNSLAVLLECYDNQIIGPAAITRHLSDILAALLQVCYAPNRMTDAGQANDKKSITSPADIGWRDRKPVKGHCFEMLEKLVKGTYQPLLVQELLALQSIPSGAARGMGKPPTRVKPSDDGLKWLRRACGQMLSERLMSKNGVQHVISGIMSVTTGECWSRLTLQVLSRDRRCSVYVHKDVTIIGKLFSNLVILYGTDLSNDQYKLPVQVSEVFTHC